ncbi:MAG: MgtC/SapB family protein [Candidatus Nanohaloarchaeota archaeon QJJ-7]|nr:MgtC/SapB family protein [Candidatus Nanohaloarchaeota archaeon QJJ-7]
MLEVQTLQQVVLAFALGALVGLERERAPEKKYAGLRTLSLLCGAGPVAVFISELSGSVVPVMIYLGMGAMFSLLVMYIRVEVEQGSLGLTTSSSVFLMALIGVLVGYGEYFSAVGITLIGVLLLAEKQTFRKYMAMLETEEISDAVGLGILALVLYPALPQGAVDPYGVLFLRKALLFVIFILLVQFAAYVALKWADTLGFLVSSALGGVVSSLAVVSTMSHMVQAKKLEKPAYAGAVAATVAMVVRNGAIAGVLAPSTVEVLVIPIAVATLVGAGSVIYLYRGAKGGEETDFGASSPFSFKAAFRFGFFFLAILLVAELAKTQFAIAGSYGAAFLGGFASSTAVVASAVTLLSAGDVTVYQSSVMVVLGIVSSLVSKLFYTEWGGARELTRKILVPYGLMVLGVLSIFLL